MKNWKAFQRRSLGLFLALVMLFGMIPVGAFAQEAEDATVPTEVETVEETQETVVFQDTEDEPVALSDTPTTVYLKPNSNWNVDNARFAVYYFNNSNGSNGWVSMTAADKDGYYTAEIPAGYPGLIFCRMNPNTTENSWDYDVKWNQTSDLTVPSGSKNAYVVADGAWDKGDGEWTAYDSQEPAPAPTDPEPSTPPTETTYYVAGTSNLCSAEWNPSGDKMEKQENGTWSITFLNVAPSSDENKYAFKVTDGTWDNTWGGTGEYGNYVLDVAVKSDVTITFDPVTEAITVTESAAGAEEPDDQYHATFHFVNSLNWSSVNLYTWLSGPLTGAWPGTSLTRDDDGFYSYTVDFTPVEGEGLNFIFSGGGVQTVDLNLPADAFVDGKAEKWVTLSDTTNGQYNANILDIAPVVVVSPKVSGTSVTFAYQGTEDTKSVQVQGDWSDTAVDMTKGDNNIWSVTVENLTPGDHTYQFLVDGKAINDPSNNMTENGKSQFTILDPNAKDENQITLNVHFTKKDGTYEDGWNVYVWGTNLDGKGYEMEDDTVNGGKILTKTFTDARALTELGAIVRLSEAGNDWVEQCPDMKADLTDIVSGTVDMYAEYDGTDWSCRIKLGSDIVKGIKLTSVQYDYDNDSLVVKAASKLEDAETAFSLETAEDAEEITISAVEAKGTTYTLTLSKAIELKDLHKYQVSFQKRTYAISMGLVYGSDKFEEEFTYDGSDLGAVYTTSGTTFKVWAPTAEKVELKLYTTGSDAEDGAAFIGGYGMDLGDKGVWALTVEGDLSGIYYTYSVTVEGETIEAVDPYGRSTGVNGKRSMVTDLNGTDPASWASDNYVTCNSITDAVIYEAHVRDFTVNAGVESPGKFLGVAEKGKTYLPELGVTHVHLLPIYDFGSVDETTGGYNWGYDPVNYNVPEGSYSTNAYDGKTRVNEMKQMVQTLHTAGVGVVMDVVYNHVYDASSFSMNQIVPGYFSRENSNGSGCGNDTASERSMVRKYIVDSVTYWAEEYHIDGFRFDLVGLIDTTTINQIVSSVKAVNPNAIFYGEGWTMGTNAEEGTVMATQQNAGSTPGFAYFSDQMRDNLAGSNDGNSLGFVSGGSDKESTIAANFQAKPGNIKNSGDPTQVVQYASCHDNYTLMDKILKSTGKSAVDDEAIAMNNLAAAIYMTSQGAPFIHSGEELLREKLNADGSRNHNSYNAGDAVNAIQWSNLEKDGYKDTFAYYQGLIAFRKAHAALRLTSASAISQRVSQQQAGDGLVVFAINGKDVDTHDSIYLIFNGSKTAKSVTLPAGSWDVCIDKDNAGTETLRTVSGTVSVPATSALVLVQKQTQDYYLVGSINGSDYGIEGDRENLGDYKFVDGKVTVTFESTSYVMVKTGDNQNWYMTKGGLAEGVTEATLYNSNGLEGADKVKVPAGTVTFTLTNGEDGTLILKLEQEKQEEQADPNAYYLTGYINGKDYTGNDYKFVDGKVTAKFTAATYLLVKKGDTTYWTDDWYENMPTSMTLYPESKAGDKKNKWQVPTGVELTITLTENDDGSITLSRPKEALEDPDALYLWGTFDGVDTDDLSAKFEETDGVLKLTKTFTKDSYVAVKNGDGSVKYMTDGFLGSAPSAKLYNKANLTNPDKLLIPAGTITFTLVKNDDGSLTLSYTTSETGKTFQDQTGIQNGVTLHCWNWSFAEIEAHLDEIKAAGYTAIQTSPVQPVKETTTSSKVGSHWWVYYQPVDFKINDSEGNALGTKTELASMISAAHAKGIKVIVDVVANHLANHLANQTGNNLSEAIPEYLRNEAYWHDITTDITNWTDRYDMTQHCMSGLPDLNTANKELQGYVLSFLKECVDVGVDGFRFDAAKSIETPSDNATFASDFWPTVINGVTDYASGKGKYLYFYGETLDDIAIATSAYTQYMSITDNGWGNHLRMMLNGQQDTPELKAGYYKSAAASNLVVWAESHDTYADGTSSSVSEDVINKTWALVAARKDAMGLYLARPESNDQLLGTASTGTGWDSPEVAAVNAFRTRFASSTEAIGNEDGISYVVRGTTGAVLVNTSNLATQALDTEISVASLGMTDGTYYDQLTGNPFTVANGTITGTIGDSGIAVVCNVTSYTVTATETTGGTVTLSSSAPAVYSTVTITAVPDEGMQVDVVTVTDGQGNAIAVTAGENGTYTFVMPASNVTVNVTFCAIPAVPATHTITVVKHNGGNVEAPETAQAGETVTVTVTETTADSVKTLLVKDANGTTVKVKAGKNGTFTFTMPDSDVTVEPIFCYNVELDVRKGGEATVSSETPAYGDTVTVKITPDSGKAVKKITVITESGKTVELTKKTSQRYTFQQPDEDVTVKITFQKSNGSAPTGDQSHIWLWVTVMAAALVILVAVVIFQVKKKHHKN